MRDHHLVQTLSSDQFQNAFPLLKPLILNEWKVVQAETLEMTEGDLDLIVEYIANQTERTQTLIRRQLAELYRIALAETADNATSTASEQPQQDATATTTSTFKEALLPSLEKSLHLLEQRAEKLLSQMDKDLLPKLDRQIKATPEIRDRLQERPGTSLLTVFGIGFVVGLIFGGFGRGR